MNWELELHRQHHRELVAEVAEARLAQEVMAEDNTAAQPRFNPALAWVGERVANLTRSLNILPEERLSRN